MAPASENHQPDVERQDLMRGRASEILEEDGSYLPLPESDGSWGPSADSGEASGGNRQRKVNGAAVGSAAMLCLGIVSVAILLSSSLDSASSKQERNPGFVAEANSLTFELHSNLPSTNAYTIDNSSALFYRPKSKEPTIFRDGMRDSSPWNESNQKSLRTSFHFQPERNWMNDPNAPLYYKGWYHLFYQYNPRSAVWGLISWGHAVSVDLIHWLYLDLAMEPDRWYDQNGVWTGSATFIHNGTPMILYTGSTNESVQVQNSAFPEDLSDPLLRKWLKFQGNPVLFPPQGIGKKDFRDPTTGWIESDGIWRVALGSKVGKKGVALIYESADFQSWKKQDHFLHQVNGTGMWECLDFFPIPASGATMGLDTSANGFGVKHVIKASMDDTKHDYYVIGTYHVDNHTFTPDDPSMDLAYGLRYDYGKYYASKTFYDPVEGRRILWGWVNESDSVQDDLQKGWACVQAIPRQIWYDNRTKSNLKQWPVEELLDLRRSKISKKGILLEGGSVVKVDGAAGAQLDIELTFDNPLTSYNGSEMVEEVGEYDCSFGGAAHKGLFGPFGLLVLAADDLQEQTAVYFYLTYKDGTWKAQVCSDQSRSSLAYDLDKSIYGSFVPVLEDEDKMSLRVILDHSIVETYAQGGRTCITSRVYPTKALDDAAQLFLFNNGTNSVKVHNLEVWHMSRVYMHPFSYMSI